MLKASHGTLIILSGIIWLIIGCVLLSLGLNFVVESILRDNLIKFSRPILDLVAANVASLDTALIIWVAFCLIVGYLKARFIFKKTVQRSVDRILTLPNPALLSELYSRNYYILLGLMVFLGVIVRSFPLDVRGGIDIIIGSALINGAGLYGYAFLIYRREKAIKA